MTQKVNVRNFLMAFSECYLNNISQLQRCSEKLRLAAECLSLTELKKKVVD